VARLRLGVALLVDPPVGTEIDGLRRAVGDPALEQVATHLTLVPPVNVRREQLPDALRRLRDAAGATAGPIELTLGPAASFLPANPVLYLEVGGDLEALAGLRASVFRPPLERPLSWPWTPHVTLGDGLAEDRIDAARRVLDGYRAVVTVDRVVLLEERRGDDGRRWVPLADAEFGAPAVVGRGGLELVLTKGRLLDPEAASLVSRARNQEGPSEGAPAETASDLRPEGARGRPTSAGRPAPIVVTARRDGQVVGAAGARPGPDGAEVWVAVAPDSQRQGIGSHLLAHLEAALRDAGWAGSVLHAEGPADFYRARSGWVVPIPSSTPAPGPSGGPR
jgi:2'-5' RNA ligase